MNSEKPSLVLASNSPRRKYLLEEADLEFRILQIHVDESYPENLSIEKVAEFLAKKKGDFARHKIGENDLCITADTIVLHEGKILEKPVDRDHALNMLNILSSSLHQVITGVALTDKLKQFSFSTLSEVEFGEITQAELEYYVDKYKPFDKAGSYGIQEWLGWCKIERISGSYSNIMGLPVFQLMKHLKNKYGISFADFK